MPNWTRNEIKAEGIGKLDIYDEKGNFDFNKLIPMPESLNMTDGSRNDTDIMYFMTDRLSMNYKDYPDQDLMASLINNTFSSKEEWLDRIFDETKEYVAKMDNKEKDEVYTTGKQLVQNYQKYGAKTWYGWCSENWGTKWNACDSEVSDDTLVFRTAWSVPLPVIEKLSEKYPDTLFKVSADYEDD